MPEHLGIIIVFFFAGIGIIALVVDVIKDPRIERCKECHQWVEKTQRYFVDDEGDLKHERCNYGK